MSLTYEKVVQEDLNVGTSVSVSVTTPSGGSQTGTQIGIHSVGVGQVAFSKVWDPGGITTLSYSTTDVTVPDAAVGDFAIASHDKMLTNDLMLTAHVSAADTVTAIMFNPTGGTLTPAEGTLRVLVMKSA